MSSLWREAERKSSAFKTRYGQCKFSLGAFKGTPRPTETFLVHSFFLNLFELFVQQGDPLGTIFFCLGFHGVLNPIFQKVDAPPNALLLLLFVDDIFVCGSPVAIAEITTQIQSVLPNANLKLGTERGKMVCFSPEAPRSNDLKSLGIGKAEVITVLGSPIGPNTQISKWLHTLAQEYQQASQDHCLIMFSNPHESLELFVKTITPKLTYICRTTPLSLTPFQDFIKQTTTTNINYLLNLLQVPHLHPNKELHLSRVEAAGPSKVKRWWWLELLSEHPPSSLPWLLDLSLPTLL